MCSDGLEIKVGHSVSISGRKYTDPFVFVRWATVENDLIVITRSRRFEGPLVSDRDRINDLYDCSVSGLIQNIRTTNLGMSHYYSR